MPLLLSLFRHYPYGVAYATHKSLGKILSRKNSYPFAQRNMNTSTNETRLSENIEKSGFKRFQKCSEEHDVLEYTIAGPNKSHACAFYYNYTAFTKTDVPFAAKKSLYILTHAVNTRKLNVHSPSRASSEVTVVAAVAKHGTPLGEEETSNAPRRRGPPLSSKRILTSLRGASKARAPLSHACAIVRRGHAARRERSALVAACS